MKKELFLLIFCVVIIVFSGCFGVENKSENRVAAENETAPVQQLHAKNITPVYGTDIKDGTYKIDVDSSSSMFKITDCELIVNGGKMSAVMTMSGKGYLYIFMGKGENAEKSGYIPFEENADGEHTFTIPVEALDTELPCSAFSKNKEQWYDRTLIFRSDSLPAEAFKDGIIATAESLGLSDGEYTVEITLEGGSGRADISSPAKLTVKDKKAFAEIIWSSSNYDYMTVDGERFDLTNEGGNSTFVIPVTGFDCKIPVTADTTAMSVPYEIEYTLYFDSSSITQ